MKIAVIDSTIRKDSRTRKVLNNVISNFNDVEFLNINLSDYEMELTNAHNFDKKNTEQLYFDLSKSIAECDGLIIAAPFWDMSYPALLKAFLEKITILDVMFKNGEDKCIGISKNKFLLYITTRGMNIKSGSKLDGATPSLKALCYLWGIPKFICAGEGNFDYVSEEEINNKVRHLSRKCIKILKGEINGKN